METYSERVGRFRVLKQLNDHERNPLGYWTLVYSTDDEADAKEVLKEQELCWLGCGDKFKIVDAGKVTFMERMLSF